MGKVFKNLWVLDIEGRSRSERLLMSGPSPAFGAAMRVRRAFWRVAGRKDWRREGLARRRGSIVGVVDVLVV